MQIQYTLFAQHTLTGERALWNTSFTSMATIAVGCCPALPLFHAAGRRGGGTANQFNI